MSLQRSSWLVAVVVVTVLAAAAWLGLKAWPEAGTSGADNVAREPGGAILADSAIEDTRQVMASFGERRDRFTDVLVARSSDAEPELGAGQGMLMLASAERGQCDDACVADANERITDSAQQMNKGGDPRTLPTLGGALTYLHVYLMFRDSPLMTDETTKALETGLRNQYLGTIFRNKGSLNIATNNPYDPTKDAAGETENHRLQLVTSGLLLSEAFAGETFDGRPIADAPNSYSEYYRTAYLNLLQPWAGGSRDSFGRDALHDEKDSPQYLAWHLGDHWLVRDFVDDEVIAKHAEIMIDRLLAEWAEDQLKVYYTGATGRNYGKPDPEYGSGIETLVLNYLLFDNVGFELPMNYPLVNSWGRWAFQSIATSDYNPTNPDFPAAIVHLARNKGSGYLVTTGSPRTANWIEDDFALGFPIDGTVTAEHQAGGFFSGDLSVPGGGFRVIPYLRSNDGTDPDSPFRKAKPPLVATGVIAQRAGILSLTRGKSSANPRLWVDDGFTAVDTTNEPWVFFSTDTGLRTVYLAVRPDNGSLSRVGAVDGGSILELSQRSGLIIWEVGTSEEYTSLRAFITGVTRNRVQQSASWLLYRTDTLGRTIKWDSGGQHTVNGEPYDMAQFDYSINNPYMSQEYGTSTATMDVGPFHAEYDWSAGTRGDYDTVPTKSVDNG